MDAEHAGHMYVSEYGCSRTAFIQASKLACVISIGARLGVGGLRVE